MNETDFLELCKNIQTLLKDTHVLGMIKKLKASVYAKDFKNTFAHIPGTEYNNEKLYLCMNNIRTIPVAACGNAKRFGTYNTAYQTEWCALPKQGKDKCEVCFKLIDSRKDKTNMGFRSPNCKKAILEKYGVENISQTDKQKEYLRSICQFADKDFREESIQKQITQHGSYEEYIKSVGDKTSAYYSTLSDEEKKEHARKTSIGRKQKHINRIGAKLSSEQKIQFMFNRETYSGGSRVTKYPFECNECKFKFTSVIHSDIDIECPNCKSKKTKSKSKEEDEFYEYIRSLYPTLHIIRNNRTILPKYELDIYIPDLNIAFEYCGVYWHQYKYVGKTKHQEKTIQCREKGIKLITVFSDDWKYKKEIVQHRLKNFMHSIDSVYARKCTIQEITKIQSEDFLNKYHIQGYSNSTYRYGLFYNDVLVAVMTLGASRYSTDYQYEILRYASSCNVVGGCGKLFKYFTKTINPESVMTYADLNYGYGDVYTKIGFVFDGITTTDYSYIHKNRDYRENRQKFQKKQLVQQGNDSELTEWQIMELNGYYRVYGCGNVRYTWKKI